MRRIIPLLALLSCAACAVNTDDREPSPIEHVQGALDAYARSSGMDTCAPGEDAVGGKCYAQCKTGYAPMADKTWCGSACPSGYTDEGDSCFRAPKTADANMNGCFSSLSCNENLFLDCMACPAGYKPVTDCKCWMGPDTIDKTTYDRSDTAKAFDACAASDDQVQEQGATVCYAACKAGFHPVGELCWRD